MILTSGRTRHLRKGVFQGKSVLYWLLRDKRVKDNWALFEAHKSGAWSFPAERKLKFANNIDLDDLLIAVGGSSNASKGSSDPSDWMPSNSSHNCEYLNKWLDIKSVFRLGIDSDEREAILKLYQENNCQKSRKLQVF